MSDSFWQSIRYVLIAAGSFFAGRGKIDPAQVAPLVDQFIQIASGAGRSHSGRRPGDSTSSSERRPFRRRSPRGRMFLSSAPQPAR
jgi:hypothetical protein